MIKKKKKKKKDLIEIRSSGTGPGNNVLTFVAVSEEEVHK